MYTAIPLRVDFVVLVHPISAGGFIALEMTWVIALILGDEAWSFDRLSACARGA